MNDSRLRRLRDLKSGPPTLISEGCKITGVLSGNGDFMISGEIDGDCDLEGTVTLTRKGFWKGSLKATSIIIAGKVEGDIVCAGRIEISDTANINGTVTGEAIAVAEGAVVQGTMKTTGKEAPKQFIEKRQSD
jgi:cytoskeletal protein CcmA (bactofilin family)